MGEVVLNQPELNTLESAPFGYIYLSEDLNAVFVNQYARRLIRCEPGASIVEFLHPDAKENFGTLVVNRNPEQTLELQLLLDIGSKAIQASCCSNRAGGLDLFVRDISESKVLGRQLQETTKPARRFVHDISNALASTIGYSELLTMMLSEEEMFAGDKLEAIRRYQSEVSEGLAKAEVLIRQEWARKNRLLTPASADKDYQGANGSSTKSAAASRTASLIRRHIVIVDDEPSIAEFLAELMRSRHYKTTTFTNSSEAHEYLVQNSNKVDLVILDPMMPDMTGIDLATNLLSMDIELPIVLCTGDRDLIENQSKGTLNIKNFISKPIDIRELTELVSSIVA